MPSQDPASRLAPLLQSTGEGIFGVDMQGRRTFINRAAAEMLGRRTEDVLGCNMHELMHHSHADGRHYPEAECPIFNAFRQGLPRCIDGEVLWRADGSSFPADCSSYPVVEGGVDEPRARARHAAPRPAVLPHPQPPGGLPGGAQQGPVARPRAGAAGGGEPWA